MSKLPILIFLLILFSHDIWGTQPQYDKQWLNLYRYKKSFGSFDSLVTNDNWFFHKDGRKDPQKELISAIEILSQSEEKRCLFPARALYLKRRNLINPQGEICPKFSYFKRKVNLESVWLVFASYYVNNPSSAFGHTLFKLKGKGNNNDLLEYGVNFAAQVTTPNPFLYALFGLTGGFKGNFSLLPYFIKISEYNDSETRDLWEYKLTLSDSELELFLAHLWEMDQANFDYYYLTENCSYHLLLFLDAIRPGLNFSKKLPYFVLPSETLSLAINTPGLISETNTRPSQFKIVQARFENFKKSQSPADKIDYLIDKMDLEKRELLLKKDPETLKEKRKLQTERAKLELPPKKLIISNGIGPHKIHPSHFIGLGKQREFYQSSGPKREVDRVLFSYRFSFHEYLDEYQGAPHSSELVLGKIEAAFNEESEKLELRDFTLFKTQANQDALDGGAGLSWGFKAGARDNPYTLSNDLGVYLDSLVGVNWKRGNSLYRIVAPQEIEVGREYRTRRYQWHSKLLLEWVGQFSNAWRARVSAGAMYSTLFGDTSPFARLDQQWTISKKVHLQLKTSLRDKDYRLGSQIIFYL